MPALPARITLCAIIFTTPASGSNIVLYSADQQTKFNSSMRLTGKKAGKKIKPDDIVKVRNLDGSLSDEFIFQASSASVKRANK